MPEATRYRRKAEAVTAVQFVPGDKPWPFGIEQDAKSGWYYADINSPRATARPSMRPPPMRCRVSPGDWLVTFDDKHKTTIRVAADLFPKMYEPLKGD